MRYCKECKKQFDEDFLFCPYCASKLSDKCEPEYIAAEDLAPEDLPYRLRPLGAWKYVAYGLLYAVPVVGWVFLIVNSTGASANINKRNFARSYWAWLLIAVAAGALGALIYGLFFMRR